MSANRLERAMTALRARDGRGVASDAPGRGHKALDPVADLRGERGR